jgi:uncharacterized protein (DUF433 family)
MTRARPREELIHEPAYSVAVVGRLLGLSPTTVRSWFFGMSNATERPFARVLEAADPENRLLSFVNLCETHVLAIVRRSNNVSMSAVRRTMRYLADDGGERHPLLSRQIRVSGRGNIFVDKPGGPLLDMTEGTQLAMREVLGDALSRIEWSERDTPVRLFPVSSIAGNAADAQRAVAIDPAVGFGSPILVDAGVSTAVVAGRFRGGDTIEELAEDYEVSTFAIQDAIRFEERVAAGGGHRLVA